MEIKRVIFTKDETLVEFGEEDNVLTLKTDNKLKEILDELGIRLL